ncbi:MAG: LptF/LptG family permease [Gemmatimonadetes bacterium]|nr:LptF/LptG family permease [Gemmatimonadota bacterium]
MRILDRFVGSTFLKLFVISLLATPPLFMLGEVTEELDVYVDRGLTTLDVLHGFMYQMPLWLTWSFPIAGLIAAVFTVHAMTAHHEVVAAKAGGISFHRLIAPILVLAALLTVVALALTEIAPRSTRVASQILQNQERGRDWRADFVYQTEEGLSLSARRLTVADGRLTGVVLERRPTDTLPAIHVQAESATWDDPVGWTLHTGYMRLLPEDAPERAFNFRHLRMEGIEERPEELLREPREEEEMTYAEIDRLARIIQRTGGQPHELLVKKEQKLAIPVATFIIVLFGAPMATSSKRGGAAYGIGVALGATIAYMALMRVASGLGASGAIPPLAAAWLPNSLFLAAGLVLMVRVRT